MRTVGVKQTQTDIAETRSCRQPSLHDDVCVCVLYIRIHNRKERNETAQRAQIEMRHVTKLCGIILRIESHVLFVFICMLSLLESETETGL